MEEEILDINPRDNIATETENASVPYGHRSLSELKARDY
jgi:hypothetical protein